MQETFIDVENIAITLRSCRICFEGDDSVNEENILFSPCLCKGSQQYIHINCLQQWRESGHSSSMIQCPTCHYKYRSSRAFYSKILTSQPVLIIATTIIIFVFFLLLGYFLDFMVVAFLGISYKKGVIWWSLQMSRWITLVMGIILFIMLILGDENRGGGGFNFFLDWSSLSSGIFFNVFGAVGLFSGMYNLLQDYCRRYLRKIGDRYFLY